MLLVNCAAREKAGHAMRKCLREMIIREDRCVNRWCAIGRRHKITGEGDLGKMPAPSCTRRRFEPGIAHMKGEMERALCALGEQTHATRHTSHVTGVCQHIIVVSSVHQSHVTDAPHRRQYPYVLYEQLPNVSCRSGVLIIQPLFGCGFVSFDV